MSARRFGGFDWGEERSSVQQHEEVPRGLRGTVLHRAPIDRLRTVVSIAWTDASANSDDRPTD